MWTSNVIPCISFILPLANSHCYFHILSMYHALYFPTFIFTLLAQCFLTNHNRKQVLQVQLVVNTMSDPFLLSPKIFFCSFQLFENGHIRNVVSTLINVVRLDFQKDNTMSTFSNAVNIKVEIDNVNLMLLNVAKFNINVHSVVLTLI